MTWAIPRQKARNELFQSAVLAAETDKFCIARAFARLHGFLCSTQLMVQGRYVAVFDCNEFALVAARNTL